MVGQGSPAQWSVAIVVPRVHIGPGVYQWLEKSDTVLVRRSMVKRCLVSVGPLVYFGSESPKGDDRPGRLWSHSVVKWRHQGDIRNIGVCSMAEELLDGFDIA